MLCETLAIAVNEHYLVFGLLEHLVQVRVFVGIADAELAQVSVLSLLHDDNIRTDLRSRLSVATSRNLD